MEAAGFELDRDRRFARRASEEITHLLALMPFKGKTYGFQWGVSLSFLPHAWKRRPEWHRTVRGARMDLFHLLYDDFLVKDPDPEAKPGEIDGLYGEAVLREDLRMAWTTQRQRLFDWFERATDVQGVAAIAGEQSAYFDAANGYLHWPTPRLVQAFCLARLGRRDEASALLELEISKSEGELNPVDGLRSAFEIVLSRGGTES
ncbi:MAG: hypothetical protein QNJ30_17465 [Kiloniellales bacterium]|nr:hypothetical protein [Kiloniellales bacterium]